MLGPRLQPAFANAILPLAVNLSESLAQPGPERRSHLHQHSFSVSTLDLSLFCISLLPPSFFVLSLFHCLHQPPPA
ncbi:hypothetical protein HDV64DRAFT_245123 [Trichoderma sp. TUCIM 5745]